MNKLSIRWRLTFWYGITLVVALSCFCLLILVLARHQSLVHIDASLQEELEERVLEVELAHSLLELDSQLRERFFQHDVYNFRVLNDKGKPIFVSSGLPNFTFPFQRGDSGESVSFETLATGGQGDFRVVTREAKGPLGSFTVQAMTPMEPYYAEIQSLQTIMLVLIPLALTLASFGGYLLAGQMLAPVKQIATVANSITIDHLDRRIEIVNPNDEIGHLSASLNSLIARLERAVNEIQRFTSDASHELRTPLAALRAEAEAALRLRRTPEEYEHTLNVVVDEASRLGRLTDQLLNLSRHDAGIINCSHESVRLDALLMDVAAQLRPLAELRNVSIEFLELQPCETQGNDIRLSQAFFNILENALKYTSAGGQVRVRCHISDHWAVIEFQDSGSGIPAEHLPHVLERFYRADSSRNCTVGGTGLGLPIAHAAVLAHGGIMELRSQPGTGTTVTVRLPDVTSASDELQPGPSATSTCSTRRNEVESE